MELFAHSTQNYVLNLQNKKLAQNHKLIQLDKIISQCQSPSQLNQILISRARKQRFYLSCLPMNIVCFSTRLLHWDMFYCKYLGVLGTCFYEYRWSLNVWLLSLREVERHFLHDGEIRDLWAIQLLLSFPILSYSLGYPHTLDLGQIDLTTMLCPLRGPGPLMMLADPDKCSWISSHPHFQVHPGQSIPAVTIVALFSNSRVIPE